MPDITISFTDAQWTRVVAASTSIKGPHGSGNVDATYLQDKLKELVSSWVQGHEKEVASVDAWE